MEDLTEARKLEKEKPNNTLIVKYEELVTYPEKSIPMILEVKRNNVEIQNNFIISQFLQLPWVDAIDKFVADHMMKKVDKSGQGTSKYLHDAQSEVSKDVANKWKKLLSQSEIQKLHSYPSCVAAIDNHENLTMFKL